MELLTLKKIDLKQTVRKALDPLEFELEMHCKDYLEDKVIFTVLYTVNVSNESEDQILSETEIYPIPKGNLKFTLEADAPDIKVIPNEQLFGLTSIIIIGKYKDEQFMRVGYIVDVYYPGIPNDKLLPNEDMNEEVEEHEEDNEEEEEAEDVNENFEDLIVEDEEEDGEEYSEEEVEEIEEEDEDVEEENGEEKPKTFTDAMVESVAAKQDETANDEEEVKPSEYSEIKAELDKPVFEEGQEEDFFEFRGYKINRKNIEMNVMVPPSIHTFLIKWNGEEEEAFETEEVKSDDDVKKIKREE